MILALPVILVVQGMNTRTQIMLFNKSGIRGG